jgi:hypothetical protein
LNQKVGLAHYALLGGALENSLIAIKRRPDLRTTLLPFNLLKPLCLTVADHPPKRWPLPQHIEQLFIIGAAFRKIRAIDFA